MRTLQLPSGDRIPVLGMGTWHLAEIRGRRDQEIAALRRGLDDLMSLRGGGDFATDQVLYNLSRRVPEWELIPVCRDLGVPVMAYSPVEQGRILGDRALRDIALRLGASPAQVALAWVLRQDGICAIPQTSRPEHAFENRAALEIHLDDDALAVLDAEFPPPLRARPLEVL